MLQVHDIRETKVYQEALAEGRQEGMEKGMEKGMVKERVRSIERLAALKKSPAEIAKLLDLEVGLVRKTLSRKK